MLDQRKTKAQLIQELTAQRQQMAELRRELERVRQQQSMGLEREISERKQLETQLVQAQKMETMGQLVGGIAHDFNNQMGIILFDVDLLLAGAEAYPQLHEDLLRIRKVVLRSASLTRQLLLFSRRQRLEPQPTDLNQLVNELRKMLGRLLGARIVVELELAPELWRVNADPATVDQVILNLAINSRDAMPDGGTLRFATRNAVVDERYCRHHSQARTGRFVCLHVSDTGVGMPEHVRLRIFEPFFTTKEEGKGTGLGLAVAYGIVRAHGGWIDVDSCPGQGSCFQVFLPTTHPHVDRPQEPPHASSSRPPGQGERILLVEDEVELRDRTLRVLTDHHYVVRVCGSLAAARAAIAAAAAPFDLVISDVVLPDGRGTDLIFSLREADPRLAALLSTAFMDDHPDWQRVAQEGIAVLEKPFTVDKLLEQVRHALG